MSDAIARIRSALNKRYECDCDSRERSHRGDCASRVLYVPSRADAELLLAALDKASGERDAAFRAGAEAMREQAARCFDPNDIGSGIPLIAAGIRALPLPEAAR